MENNNLNPSSSSSSNATTQPNKKIPLIHVPIKNSNEALQMIVEFLMVAQNRGTFTFPESAKIWECMQYFK